MKRRWIILLILLLLFFLGIFLFFSNLLKGLYSEDYGQFKVPNYVLNSDGNTISDNSNNLMWQKSSTQERLDWNAANEYCNSLNLSEFENWRLPAKEELVLIYDSSKNTSLWTSELSVHGFWSSTTESDDPSFAYGFRTPTNKASTGIISRSKTDRYYFVALCVRSQ